MKSNSKARKLPFVSGTKWKAEGLIQGAVKAVSLNMKMTGVSTSCPALPWAVPPRNNQHSVLLDGFLAPVLSDSERFQQSVNLSPFDLLFVSGDLWRCMRPEKAFVPPPSQLRQPPLRGLNYFEADIRRCRWLGILLQGGLACTNQNSPASSSFHPRPGSARSLWLLGTRASWRRLSPTQGTQLPYPA